MEKKNYNVVGVMSGTSLDGIDLAYINFNLEDDAIKFKILMAETIKYSDSWVETLKNASFLNKNELKELDERYTILLSKVILNFIKSNNIENSIDAICSHGHTILHKPNLGITLQIGNLPQMAELLKQNVVCNFRVQDVLLGGQGAPLVPIGDRILFSKYKYCLNLGGFSNISFEDNYKRVAYDICAVNTVLNYYANKLNLEYDNNGNVAKLGRLNTDLFNALNRLTYYQLPYPKSLGIEWVNENVFPLINSFSITEKDILHTYCHHIAFQLQQAIKDKKASILITGGGAYHSFLIHTLKEYLSEAEIIIPNHDIIQFKEALIFGLLGVLKLQNKTNVLSSVTGASQDHSSGYIYYYNS